MEMFKSNLASYVVTFLLGFLCCLYFTKWGCVESKIKEIDTGGWIQHHYDTVKTIVDRPVPIPTIVYKTKKEIQYILAPDTFDLDLGLPEDSLLIVADTSLIPINYYEDSIKTSEYEFKWKAETFGFLTSMVPEITIFQDSITIDSNYIKRLMKKVKPTWTIQAGLSNRLNYKLGMGYKGWLIESEFHNLKFNQLYLTKQWQF